MERPEFLHGVKNQNSLSSEDSGSSEVSEINSEDEETSSSGSSSENEVDSSDDEEGADEDETPASSSPSAKARILTSPKDLKSILASFIPQLQQANAELETDAGLPNKRIDNVADDEEQYIEMNLGLGVLKAKSTAEHTKGVKIIMSEDSDSSDEDSRPASEDEAGAGTTEVGIVDKLKGVRPPKRKIEEVG